MDAPANFRITSRTSSSLTFEWDAVDGAIGYYLQHDNAGWTDISNTTELSFVYEGLQPYTNSLPVRVGAFDGADYGWTDAIIGTTWLEIPSNISTSPNTTSITINWTDAANAVGIFLYRDGEKIAEVLSGTGTYEDNERVHVVTYTYTLISCIFNESLVLEGFSDTSSGYEGTIPLPQLDSPTSLSMVQDNNVFNISWDTVNNAATYQIDYSIDNQETWNSLINTAGLTASLVDCVVGTIYYIRVKSQGAGYTDSNYSTENNRLVFEVLTETTMFIDGSIIEDTGNRIIVIAISNCIF